MPSLTDDVGAAIARLRVQRGWSQAVLADAAGVAQSTVSRVEAGGADVDITAGGVRAVLTALGVTAKVVIVAGGDGGEL